MITSIDHIVVTVADPEGNTDNQTVRITVNGVNDVPMVMNQTVNVGEDMSTNIFLMAEDVDGDPLNYTIVDMPTNGTVSGNGNSVTYTPTMNFTGTDRFTWRANDGNGGMSALATVDIVIGNANDAPVFSGATPADGDVVAGNEGDTISFTLEAMDDKGVLDRGDPADFGLDMAHLDACRAAEDAARRVIERLAPDRAEPHLMLDAGDLPLQRLTVISAHTAIIQPLRHQKLRSRALHPTPIPHT